MIRRAPLVKPALAAALLLLLAAEWLLPANDAGPAHERAAIPAAAMDSGQDTVTSQWADTILARPLFNPGRRPASDASASAAGTLPRLSAIIISGGTSSAIFDADGQKPQVVAPGGNIDGYQLEHITPNSVDLLGPGGQLTLRPKFASGAAATTANTPGFSPTTAPATTPVLNPATNPALLIEQNF